METYVPQRYIEPLYSTDIDFIGSIQKEINDYCNSFYNYVRNPKTNSIFTVLMNTIYSANTNELDSIPSTLYLIGDNITHNTLLRTSKTFKSLGLRCESLSTYGVLNGGLGVISPTDTIIFVSKSGNNEEILKIMRYFSESAKGHTHKDLEGITMFSISMSDENSVEFDNFKHIKHIRLPEVKEVDKFGAIQTVSLIGFQIFFDVLVFEVSALIGTSYIDYTGNNPPPYSIETSDKYN